MCLCSLGDRVTPLVQNPGQIVLTTAFLYFQPFNKEPVSISQTSLYRFMDLWIYDSAITRVLSFVYKYTGLLSAEWNFCMLDAH